MKRKLLLIIIMVIFCSFLTGCEEVQWFKTEKDNRLKAYTDDQLELGTYYVKQGTRFFEVYKTKGDPVRNASTSVNGSKVYPLTTSNEEKVPSHYINEGIAYKSNKEILTMVKLERFKSLGYSIGLYNGKFDETGYLYFDKSKCLAKDSNMSKYLSDSPSNDIRLISINGERLTQNMIDIEAGVIPNLEKDKVYTVQMYIGTTFVETDILADTQMLKSYEVFSYDNSYITFTQNGYIIFNTPNDLKSGYYFIDDAGLFKYFDHEKTSIAEDEATDMNISYYEDEQSMLEAQSRQYTVDIPNKVKELGITVYYSGGYSSYDEDTVETVKGYVFGPDKTKYEMTINEEDKTLSLMMTEAIPGEWTINITPKTTEILDVKIDSTKIEEEATLKTKDFTFNEDETNVRFRCDIVSTTGEEDVYGYITSPDGRTYNMIVMEDRDKKENYIYYDSPFVAAGLWTVKIYYHPTVTELGDIETSIETETDTDVIIIGD